jgi:hypothetical protein
LIKVFEKLECLHSLQSILLPEKYCRQAIGMLTLSELLIESRPVICEDVNFDVCGAFSEMRMRRACRRAEGMQRCLQGDSKVAIRKARPSRGKAFESATLSLRRKRCHETNAKKPPEGGYFLHLYSWRREGESPEKPPNPVFMRVSARSALLL